MTTATVTTRRIGPYGSVARVALGGVLLAGAASSGPSWIDLAVGLVAYPAAVSGVLALRGAGATPLRLIGPSGHLLNLAVLVPAAVVAPIPWLLFIGVSLLLAAVSGYAGCELFAISNWLRRRDDQIACPVLHPIDAAEARAAGREPGW